MTDSLAAEARRLRTVEQLSARQIQARLGIGKDKLYELLRGVPPPAWTKRPNAKDDLHQLALKLRGEGRSVVDIAWSWGWRSPPPTSGSSICRSTLTRKSRWQDGAHTPRP